MFSLPFPPSSLHYLSPPPPLAVPLPNPIISPFTSPSIDSLSSLPLLVSLSSPSFLVIAIVAICNELVLIRGVMVRHIRGSGPHWSWWLGPLYIFFLFSPSSYFFLDMHDDVIWYHMVRNWSQHHDEALISWWIWANDLTMTSLSLSNFLFLYALYLSLCHDPTASPLTLVVCIYDKSKSETSSDLICNFSHFSFTDVWPYSVCKRWEMKN